MIAAALQPALEQLGILCEKDWCTENEGDEGELPLTLLQESLSPVVGDTSGESQPRHSRGRASAWIRGGGADAAALTDFCQALMSSNEFLYLP